MAEIKDKLITAENLKNAYDDNKRQIGELKGDLDNLHYDDIEIIQPTITNGKYITGYQGMEGKELGDENSCITSFIKSSTFRRAKNESCKAEICSCE